MKKSMFLLLIMILGISCSHKQKERHFEVMSMSKLEKLPEQNVSIAEVRGSDKNGKDIADVKSNVISLENGDPNFEAKNKPSKATPPIIKKKIIKDGNIGLQVKNLEKAKLGVDTLVKKVGGYYASENLQNSDQASGYQLTIRIPVVNFDAFINFIEKGEGKVLSKVINARDVTEEFVDLETRINSKRNSLARYNEIMKKANTVKDIVAIEESIRVLQEEIESTEGKLHYLNDCVNYSTLNLTISTEKDFTFKPARRDSFWEKLKESITDGWYGLVDFILEFFGLWPYLILIIPIGFLIRRLRKKWKLRNKEKK